MTIEVLEVESPFGVTVRNQFHHHDSDSARLMIILPGRGYTVNHPVLFHLGHMAFENGYDVLPVQYGFHAGGALEPAQIPLLQEEVQRATKPVLARDYSEVCVVGKSLGTPLAIDLARSLDVERVSQILLTPIGAAMQAAGDIPTLAIIGTADPLYAAENIQESATLTWKVYERLGHGLVDEADWRYSVQVLQEIIAACETFLKDGN